MKKILVLHGPNLNLLGVREPGIYGAYTLREINDSLSEKARKYNVQIAKTQSNSEEKIIDVIQNCEDDFILFNPAAFTHTSIAIRDALLAVKIPFIEIHLTNIYAREAFRHTSYFSDIAVGVISGFGRFSYLYAFEAAIEYFNVESK